MVNKGEYILFTARCYASRGLCCRKMSIRLSHAGILSKRLHYMLKLFLPSASQTILVFLYLTEWQYSDMDLNNSGTECKVV